MSGDDDHNKPGGQERPPEPSRSTDPAGGPRSAGGGPRDDELRIFLPPEPGSATFGQRRGPIPPPPRQTPKPPPKAPKERRPKDERPSKDHQASEPRKISRRLAASVMAGLLLVALVGIVAGSVYLFHDLPRLPDPEALFAQTRTPAMTFQDQNGEIIATRGKKIGYRVKLAELPPYVPQAFLAAEDRRFYSHGPIDLKGTIRAGLANMRSKRVVQGGSTITQQITKTLFLKPDRTLKRKAQEAILAWRLERRLGKDQVLELYLNRIFFGEGAYGLDAAAQIYFGKSASQLTLAEASLLAALPQQPSRFALRSNMTGARDRQTFILETMGEEGWINQAQFVAASAAPPALAPSNPGEGDIGYVLDYAAAEAAKLTGPGAPDLLITLTIDPRLQAVAQDVLRRTLATDGRAAHASQGAFVAITPDGAVRALVGGQDHATSPFNRATQARRQPGSSFKPFVYAAALETGVKPNDVYVDAPLRLGGWRPTNYGGGYRGAVTVQTALAQSINTVAVKLGMKATAPKIGELARRFGMTTIPANPDLAISLGAKEVTLLELVSGFQVFQNAGERRPPYLIASITSTRGDPIYAHTATTPMMVYDPEMAGWMVDMMRGVVERGTGTRAALGRPAAGKTGTSQDWRDAWFVGFTPDWAGGVWIGNDDYTPMDRVAGGTLPAAIWRQFMTEAHKGMPARGFDWVVPFEAPAPPPPPPSAVIERTPPDPRNNFYNDLADDFAGAAGGEE